MRKPKPPSPRSVSATLAAADFRAWNQYRAEGFQAEYAMRRDGWVLLLAYGTEGDCVRVVKRTMDGTDGT